MIRGLEVSGTVSGPAWSMAGQIGSTLFVQATPELGPHLDNGGSSAAAAVGAIMLIISM